MVAEQGSRIRVEGALRVGLAPTSDEPSASFIRLAESALPGAYRLAGFLLCDSWEAQDATQEALLKAWLGWPRLRDRGSFGPWFDRIVVNVCKNQMRARKGIRPLHLDEQMENEAGTTDPFRSALARDELGRLVGKLSPDQQIVVALRFWRDLSLDEIAARLDLPPGTVKSRLHYAVRALRAELDRQTKEVSR